MSTIRIDRRKFIEALAAVEPAVPRKPQKPILTNVRFAWDPGKAILTATDTEISVSFPLECDSFHSKKSCDILLPAARLRMILNELNSEKFSLTIEKGKAVIEASLSMFTVPTEDPAEFPAFPAAESDNKFSLKGVALGQAIRRTIYATDAEASRYALGGVKFDVEAEETKIVATDSRRLSLVSLPSIREGNIEDFGQILIPTKTLTLLEKVLPGDPVEDVEFHLLPGSKTVAIHSGFVQIVTRLVEGRFPRYQDVVPNHANSVHRLTLPVGPLLSAVRQSQITTAEESRGVDFCFQSGLLVLSSEAAAKGSARIELPVIFDSKITVTLDPQYVVDFLRSLSAADVVEVHITKPDEAVLMMASGVSYQHVLMPLSQG